MKEYLQLTGTIICLKLKRFGLILRVKIIDIEVAILRILKKIARSE